LLGDLPEQAVFGGSTAAWIHGLDSYAIEPVEVFLPETTSVKSRIRVVVRRSNISATEATTVRSLPVTTVARTLRDICLFRPQVEGLVASTARCTNDSHRKRRCCVMRSQPSAVAARLD
jgi:predicted transcriptional regulator of viral defense system